MKNLQRISVKELRRQFEDMARLKHFDLERNCVGEYGSTERNTFILWAGYWECAKNNGIIPINSTVEDMHTL